MSYLTLNKIDLKFILESVNVKSYICKKKKTFEIKISHALESVYYNKINTYPLWKLVCEQNHILIYRENEILRLD